MNYDDALITLVADVATAYVNLRGLDERIRLARENVNTQQTSLDIANVRFPRTKKDGVGLPAGAVARPDP